MRCPGYTVDPVGDARVDDIVALAAPADPARAAADIASVAREARALDDQRVALARADSGQLASKHMGICITGSARAFELGSKLRKIVDANSNATWDVVLIFPDGDDSTKRAADFALRPFQSLFGEVVIDIGRPLPSVVVLRNNETADAVHRLQERWECWKHMSAIQARRGVVTRGFVSVRGDVMINQPLKLESPTNTSMRIFKRVLLSRCLAVGCKCSGDFAIVDHIWAEDYFGALVKYYFHGGAVDPESALQCVTSLPIMQGNGGVIYTSRDYRMSRMNSDAASDDSCGAGRQACTAVLR